MKRFYHHTIIGICILEDKIKLIYNLFNLLLLVDIKQGQRTSSIFHLQLSTSADLIQSSVLFMFHVH